MLNALWNSLKETKAVMISAASSKHMQPMSPNPDRENNAIWFFTSNKTGLAAEVAKSGTGMVCVIEGDFGLHACLSGTLSLHTDKDIIDRFWSPVAGAWFEGGKTDPDLVLIRFKPSSASIWVSTESAVRFGYEIAKAKLFGGTPDVGAHAEFNLS